MGSPSTLNVALTPRLRSFVQSEVRSGRYGSASEVVRDALRLLEDENSLHMADLKAVRKRIAQGLAVARQGRLTDGEVFFAELEKERPSSGRATGRDRAR